MLFVFSRTAYGLLGVGYDITPLASFLQFIDLPLLQDHFWQSIYYYHAGPPVLNLIAGFGIAVFGNYAFWFFAALFHALGLCLLLSAYSITNRLCEGKRSAQFVVLLLCFSPSFVLYENWLMYTFIASSLLTCSAALLIKYLDTREFIWGFSFFSCIAILSLTRTFFLFYWLVLVTLILMAIDWKKGRQVLVCAFIPLLVCFSWNAKNYYLFNTFSTSSISGLSLNNVTTLTVPWDVLSKHLREGELSKFSVVSRYETLHKVILGESLAEPVGIPVLDNPIKSNGKLNYNSLDMLVASKYYLEDGVKVIRKYPFKYLKAVGAAHQVYLSPASLNRYFSESNLAATRIVSSIYDPLFFGASPNSFRIEQPHFGYTKRYSIEIRPGFLLATLSVLLLLYGSWRCFATILKRDWRTETVLFGYIFGCWLLVYLASVYFEFSENNRYRFIAEPIFWIQVVFMIGQLRLLRGQSDRELDNKLTEH